MLIYFEPGKLFAKILAHNSRCIEQKSYPVYKPML